MGRLVLTRRAGQSVNIGESLVLHVREVQATRVYVQVKGLAPTWLRVGEMAHIPVDGSFCQCTVASTQHGHTAKLLFEADRSVSIVRSELLPS